MKKSTLYITLLFLFSFLTTEAKKNAGMSIRRLENKSIKAYLDKDYNKALHYLYQLDTVISDRASKYDYWIGMCLLSTDNKLAAIPYLESARNSGETSFVINYYLGRAYLFAGKYDYAKKYLTAYIRQYMSNGVNFEVQETPVNLAHSIHVEKSVKDVLYYLEQCDNGLINNSNSLTLN